MKSNQVIIVFAIVVAALSTMSCRNNKKSQSSELTLEDVQSIKQELADSSLAQIDVFMDKYIEATENGFSILKFELTDSEKLIKPDYLLDPAEANNLVTKKQKVSALAIYIPELAMRMIYGMPIEETKEAIAKLAFDVNYPIDIEKYDKGTPTNEIIRSEYEKCKENEDLSYFILLQRGIIVELGYLMAQNPDFFFSRITEEEWQAYNDKVHSQTLAIKELSQYDEEMNELWQQIIKNRVTYSDNEFENANTSISAAIEYRKNNKDKFITKRNALLQ